MWWIDLIIYVIYCEAHTSRDFPKQTYFCNSDKVRFFFIKSYFDKFLDIDRIISKLLDL